MKLCPPRISATVLRWALGRGIVGEAMAGDCLEEFHGLAGRDGETLARQWYRKQALLLVGYALLRRLRRNQPGLGRSRPAPAASAGNGRSSRSRNAGPASALLRDVRFALRAHVRHRGFTALTTLTLALGIGATTTIFSVVDNVLLRPLPYPEAARLAQIGMTFPESGNQIGVISYPNFEDLRDETASFDIVVGSFLRPLILTGSQEAARLQGAAVSADYFSILGAAPALGRALVAGDDRKGASPVAVLSHRIWRTRFGADSGVLGTIVTLNSVPHEVVGIMPVDFRPPEALRHHDVDVWTALVVSGDRGLTRRTSHFVAVLGLRSRDVPLAQTRLELDAIAEGLAVAHESNRSKAGHLGFWAESLQRRTVGNIGSRLGILLGAVSFLLLIACANVANLLLARSAVRSREIALRAALGAGRSRLIGQLMTESVLLALLGGVLGAAVAFTGVAIFKAFPPGDIPRLAEVTVDLRVLAFVLGLSIGTGILFGLAPAMQLAGRDLADALREGGARALGGRRITRFRAGLVVTEVALALVLLLGAGLLINSFVRLSRVDSGVDPRSVYVVQLDFGAGYENEAEQVRFLRQVLPRISAIPGVHAASSTSTLPLQGPGSSINMTSDALLEAGPETETRYGRISRVGSQYFQVVGMTVMAGRDFTANEEEADAMVAVVNQQVVREFFPDGAAVGRRVWLGGEWRTVVGVVNDVKQTGLGDPAEAQVYLPRPASRFARVNILFRYSAELAAVLPAVRQAIRETDPNVPISDTFPLERQVSAATMEARFYTLLLTTFAVTALSLAVIGIYGVIAYSVGHRRGEVGLRVALGARPVDILQLIVRQGLVITALGLAVGLATAVAATRLLSSFVFGISVTHTPTFAAVTVVLGMAAMLACVVPAWKATRIDPMEALRAE